MVRIFAAEVLALPVFSGGRFSADGLRALILLAIFEL